MCIRDRRNSDKGEIGDTAKKYAELGFDIYATKGTAEVLKDDNLYVAV